MLHRRVALVFTVLMVSMVAFPSIARAAVPTVINRNADVNGTVTLHGDITNTGVVGDDDERGFVWGLFSFPEPGDVAPGASGYTDDWTEAGSFGTGAFSYDIAGLTLETVYYYRAAAHSVDGWAYSDEICFFVLEDKVYLEFRPRLIESTLRTAGVPTSVHIGVFNGYSLPIWSDPVNKDEQLFFEICVPNRWDGESNIVLHLDLALADAGESGNAFSMQIAWENVTPNEEPIPVTSNLLVGVKNVYSNAQYELYQCSVAIDYDIDPTNPIVIDDILAFRLRRLDVGGQLAELNGELIVLHEGILFARGDILGDPDAILGDDDMEMFALAFIAVMMTVAMFVTKQTILGFPAALFWLILGGYAFTESTVAWGDWQYYLGFGSIAGMAIFTALLAALSLRSKPDLTDDDNDKGDPPTAAEKRTYSTEPVKFKERRKTLREE